MGAGQGSGAAPIASTQVLFDAAEAIRIAAVLLLPIMPASAAEILRRVGETRAARDLRLDRDAAWRNERRTHIVTGRAAVAAIEKTSERCTVTETPKEPTVGRARRPGRAGGTRAPTHRRTRAPAAPRRA